MSNDEITADALDEYIQAYRRVHGKWPRTSDCVEHFDGKLLNVLMSIWELKDRKLEPAGRAKP